ncbi:hypothetical protein [Streptomyces zaehneri]|uniref:hypothetical protein n=1 Tax=Streptomyces zaehneri TaxID=3051180 RepID=UPI0028D49977|nr:hypothetical protein [Streptomyces sp. DSM 40713]
MTGNRADAALALRLAHLALPVAPGAPAPPERGAHWSGAEFTPGGGFCADQPELTGAVVTAGPDGWTLSLVEEPGARRLVLPLGTGGRHPGEEPPPTAVSGGWTDGDTLAVHVVFLETPHRLRVTCSLADRTFTARWDTKPLHGAPLRRLRAPRRSPRSGG